MQQRGPSSVPRIFPDPSEWPPRPQPPAPQPSRRPRRDVLLARGLAVMAVSAALLTLATFIRWIDDVDDDGLFGGAALAELMRLVSEATFAVVWVLAAQAVFTGGERRDGRLAAAARLALAAAIAGAASAVAELLTDASIDSLPGTVVASDVMAVFGALAFVVVALAAFLAFAGSAAGETGSREGRLGWAAVAFAVGSALGFCASALLAIAFGEVGASDALVAGLWIAGAGEGVAIGAGTVAAAALLVPAARTGEPAERRARRDRALALAAGGYAAATLVATAGGAVVAAALGDNFYGGREVAAAWIGVVAGLAGIAAATIAAAGFAASGREPGGAATR
jgi:hypothetical protein